MASTRSLADVPEEDDENTTIAFGKPNSGSLSAVYSMPSASSSSSTLYPNSNGRPSTVTATARRSSSLRSLVASNDTPGASSAPVTPTIPESPAPQAIEKSSIKRATSSANSIVGASGTPSTSTRPSAAQRHRGAYIPRMRSTPRLVHEKEAQPAPSTGMYWSRAPVWGAVPNRTMRAHSATLVGDVVWLFGGCDEKESWKDIYCLDTQTLQWTHPECQGDAPPPSRAHSATLVGQKIVFIGGGHGSVYYDSVYILDTSNRKWSRPVIPPGPKPPQRRAHTAVLYGSKIWVFGGGNGMMALADVWTLDVSALMPHFGPFNYSGRGGKKTGGDMITKWELVETWGVKKPGPRGYHTANLVTNVMVVIGGSDGKESFDELWTLNLDTKVWTQIQTNMPYKRLAHSSTCVGSYLFIFGGHDSTEYTSQLILLNLVSLQYEERKVYGKVPTPRGYHAVVLSDSRLFVIGGFNGMQSFDDVHILELASSAYLPQVTSFEIEALG